MTQEGKRCAVCNREYRLESDFLTKTARWRLCTEGNLWFNCACGSTLVLPKGRFSWYSPELSLGVEARGVFNRLANLKELPHVPHVAMAILQMAQDPNVLPGQIAKELRKEPVIATQILKIAEAIRNARSPETSRFKTLEHAVVYIGMKALSDLIVTSALRTMPLPESRFDAKVYWDEAYLTGAIAEFLKRRFAPQLNADEVFLAGSLCNIGKLVMAFCFPPLASKLMQDTAGDHQPLYTWRQAEEAYQFPNHCILGEIAATLWGFPLDIVIATRQHHDLDARSTRVLNLNEVVAAANQFTHWVLLRLHRMEYGLLEGFAARAGLKEDEVVSLSKELAALAQALKEAPVQTPA